MGSRAYELLAVSIGQGGPSKKHSHTPMCGCNCSMGGILVKEMLVKSLAPGAPAEHARLARATRGLAFYATPHHGSWLADVGWNLRFLGASPAASVVHLKRGPQQEVGRPLDIHCRWHKTKEFSELTVHQ